jgi:hypothetical protein
VSRVFACRLFTHTNASDITGNSPGYAAVVISDGSAPPGGQEAWLVTLSALLFHVKQAEAGLMFLLLVERSTCEFPLPIELLQSPTRSFVRSPAYR